MSQRRLLLCSDKTARTVAELTGNRVHRLQTELDSGEHETWGGVVFTDGFPYEDLGIGVTILPLDAVVWAYEEVTEHSKAGLIHTHDTAKVRLHLRNGQVHTIDAPPGESQNILLCLEQRSQGTMLGYDEAMKARWRDDAAGLVRSIDRLTAQGRLHEGAAALSGELLAEAKETLDRLHAARAEAEARLG